MIQNKINHRNFSKQIHKALKSNYIYTRLFKFSHPTFFFSTENRKQTNKLQTTT